MGVVPSCYPTKSQRRVTAATQPYDTRRLLSELITVQTAIVLNEDATNETAILPPGVVGEESELGAENADPSQPVTPQRRGSIRESRRRSVEYTITSKTSRGFPGDLSSTTTTTTTTSKSDVSTMNTTLGQTAADLVGSHIAAHNRDLQRATEDGKKMPSIKEMTETSVW